MYNRGNTTNGVACPPQWKKRAALRHDWDPLAAAAVVIGFNCPALNQWLHSPASSPFCVYPSATPTTQLIETSRLQRARKTESFTTFAEAWKELPPPVPPLYRKTPIIRVNLCLGREPRTFRFTRQFVFSIKKIVRLFAVPSTRFNRSSCTRSTR